MDLTSILNAVSSFVNHIPQYAHLVAPWLGGGLIASIAVQTIKHKLQLTNARILTFTLVVLSFAESAIQYLSNQASQNPTVLGKNTAALVGIATALYRLPIFGVKDMHQLILDAQSKRSETAVPPSPAVGQEPFPGFPVVEPTQPAAVFEG